MTYRYNLFGQMERFENEARRALAGSSGLPVAPGFKSAADSVTAHQAVIAALRGAELTGPLDADGLGQALTALRAVRDAYVFLGDSRAASETLNAAVNLCQEHAMRSLESAIA